MKLAYPVRSDSSSRSKQLGIGPNHRVNMCTLYGLTKSSRVKSETKIELDRQIRLTGR